MIECYATRSSCWLLIVEQFSDWKKLIESKRYVNIENSCFTLTLSVDLILVDRKILQIDQKKKYIEAQKLNMEIGHVLVLMGLMQVVDFMSKTSKKTDKSCRKFIRHFWNESELCAWDDISFKPFFLSCFLLNPIWFVNFFDECLRTSDYSQFRSNQGSFN